MTASLSRLGALLIILLLVVTPVLAESRVALVIGNSAYKDARALANPRNDAEAVAASLRRLKFEVLAGLDLDEAASRRLLREFAEKLEGLGKDDVAVLFYAGHGLQVNGRNYLVPVDAKLEKERDLDFQAVSFDFVQQLMEKTAQTNIVILDSCRDNPLARTLARGMRTRSTSIGRGLAEVRGISDTLIVYATSPGNVALDGAEKHSPFTEALLKHMEQPGLEVRHMVAQVRAAVIAATKGQQVPWEAASLTRQIYFAPSAAPGAAPAPAAPAPPGGPAPEGEIVFWQSIKDSKNAADFKDYLARWPQGTFAEIAKRRISEIEKAAAVTPPAPEKPAPQPAPPQRTSSYLNNGWIYGNFLGKNLADGSAAGQKVANAQACAALCIRNPKCVAWMLWTSPGDPRLGTCWEFSRVSSRSENNNTMSGVIRTTPAAGMSRSLLK